LVPTGAVMISVVASCGASGRAIGAADPTAPAVTAVATTQSIPEAAANFPATTVFANTSLQKVPLTLAADATPRRLELGESWCPKFATQPSGAMTEADMFAISAVAERNLGGINYYLTDPAKDAESGSAWLDSASRPARVVIGFTAHVAEHRAALAGLVRNPDEVLVCQVRHTHAETATASAEIQASLGNDGVFRSIGAGADDAVAVELRADQEAAAADLVKRYGDLVAVTVGNFPYPMPADRSSLRADACRFANVAGPKNMQGLVATVSLNSATVRSGLDGEGIVTVTNNGSESVSINTGSPLVGAVVRSGTSTVVGVFLGAIGGLGDGATLQPGQSHDIQALFGTASCDATLGYALPPGNYEVLVPAILTSETTPTNVAPPPRLVSMATPLTIVA
jgi:hypothetical protein